TSSKFKTKVRVQQAQLQKAIQISGFPHKPDQRANGDPVACGISHLSQLRKNGRCNFFDMCNHFYLSYFTVPGIPKPQRDAEVRKLHATYGKSSKKRAGE